MASRTALLEEIANRFLARREELAPRLRRKSRRMRRVKLNTLGGEVRNG